MINLKIIMLFFITAWTVCYNNSIMIDFLPRETLSLFPQSFLFRLIEILFITLLFIYTLALKLNSRNMTLSIIFFLFIITLGLVPLFNIEYLYFNIMSIFFLISPIFIYYILSQIDIQLRDVYFVVKFYFTYIIINVLVVIILSIPKFGNNPDHLMGLFSDAHVFGTFLSICSIYFYNFGN